jgi:hypothetical protein
VPEDLEDEFMEDMDHDMDDVSTKNQYYNYCVYFFFCNLQLVLWVIISTFLLSPEMNGVTFGW